MFIPIKSTDGAMTPFEYIEAAAGTYQAVTRVQGKYTFETELAAAAAAVKVGAKIQVASGGLKAKYVTGASDAAVPGTFEVVSLEGTAAGSMIRGRFV